MRCGDATRDVSVQVCVRAGLKGGKAVQKLLAAVQAAPCAVRPDVLVMPLLKTLDVMFMTVWHSQASSLC